MHTLVVRQRRADPSEVTETGLLRILVLPSSIWFDDGRSTTGANMSLYDFAEIGLLTSGPDEEYEVASAQERGQITILEIPPVQVSNEKLLPTLTTHLLS